MRSLPSGSPYQTRGTLRPSTGEYCPSLRIAAVCRPHAVCRILRCTRRCRRLCDWCCRVLTGAAGYCRVLPGGPAAQLRRSSMLATGHTASLSENRPISADAPRCMLHGSLHVAVPCCTVVAWNYQRPQVGLPTKADARLSDPTVGTVPPRWAHARWPHARGCDRTCMGEPARTRPKSHLAFKARQSKGWEGKTTVVANALCLWCA